ncbi:hypothetical protein [Enhygromyxa salina]|uniref:Lipoprotein n=1 Tax=Enhygromyxa salina TaxID=215803 RepID=A0A2S9YJ27_9BACT|nr:hypothetical protein [Enhygromyxa salina]PRQ05107.1 hypothetical protein ENSA7_47360 [Enhygromyxa salina]
MRRTKTALTFAAALLGLTTLGSCTEPEPENFATIRIEMSPTNGTTELFAGTTEITATVQYETCLQDFYLVRQPTFQKDGTDGAPVFADFEDRLCSDFMDIPDCEVTEIKQNLIDANQVYSLAVTFKINDPSTLPYRELHIGPLPVEAFAGCDSGQGPSVELRQSGLIGKNSAGTQIWRIGALPGTNIAVANQGAPLRVDLVAN